MYRLLTVTGGDAFSFLQGQLTQDVERVTADDSLPGAWCNPQGRVLATLRLIAHDDGIGMVVATDIAERVAERLAMYRLRAAVDIALAGKDWRAVASADAGDLERLDEQDLLPPPGGTLTRSGVHIVRSSSEHCWVEFYATAEALDSSRIAPETRLSDSDWRNARVRAGIPSVGAAISERFTPHMLNLDRLGYVSFNKGCYTGQEIVARTENLGRSRRRLAVFASEGAAISPGDNLTREERDVGEVIEVAGTHFLAVLPVDLARDGLSVNGVEVTAQPLPYEL